MSYDQLLAQLEDVQLLRRLIEPEPAYIFKHTLTQETAYQSLLVKRRREIHRAVARSYERLYPDRLDEYAPLLAQHYAEAGDDERTFAYSRRAGEVAAHLYAHVEAIEHFTRALNAARRIAADSAQVTSVYLARGRSLELLGAYPEALANYQEMEGGAREHGDQPMELAALIAQATLRSTPTPLYESDTAQALSHRAVALARALHDPAAESKALWNLMLAHFFAGLPAEADGEQALALARQAGDPEQLAMILNDLGRSYAAAGHIDQAWDVLEESRRLWQQSDNLPMRAENLGNLAEYFMLAGEYDRALGLSAEAYGISQSIGNSWGLSYALMSSSVVYFDRGEFDQAIAVMQECIHHAEQIGFAPALIYQRSLLGLTYGLLDSVEQGLDLAQAALEVATRQMPIVHQTPLGVIALLHLARGDIQRAAATLTSKTAMDGRLIAIDSGFDLLADGELALARGEYASAVEQVDGMLGILHRYQIRLFETDALLIKGKALLAQQRYEEAKTSLAEAKVKAEALDSRRSLARILPALAKAERRLGNNKAAVALNEQSQAVIDAILAHISDPEFRAGFLRQVTRE